MRKRSRVILGTVLILAIMFGLAGVLLAYLGGDAEMIETNIDNPPQVLAGQPFRVTLDLHNTTDDDQYLLSIGLKRDMVEKGVSIDSSIPFYQQVEDLDGSPWMEYSYGLVEDELPAISPGETLPMRLRMKMSEPGEYDITLAFWLYNRFRADYATFQVSVLPHPAPWLGR